MAVDYKAITRAMTTPPQRPADSLTQREHEIILAVADGMRNRDIGKKYEISEETVKRHLSNIFNKLGCNSRTEMVLMYLGGTATVDGLLRGYVCSVCDKEVLIRGGTTPTSMAFVTNDDGGFDYRTVCPPCAKTIQKAISSALKELHEASH